jgi:hypothetical protein
VQGSDQEAISRSKQKPLQKQMPINANADPYGMTSKKSNNDSKSNRRGNGKKKSFGVVVKALSFEGAFVWALGCMGGGGGIYAGYDSAERCAGAVFGSDE